MHHKNPTNKNGSVKRSRKALHTRPQILDHPSPSAKTNRTLQERETLLQAIMDNSTRLIYLKDTEGRYQFVNRQYEKLFNLSLESIQGKTDYDIFPRHIADSFRANDLKVLQSRTAMEFEESALFDDETHIYISNKFPLINAAGAAYAVCGISTDITNRKQMEEREMAGRRAAESWLHTLIQTIQDAVISIDRDGRIVLFNPAAERIFGYSKAEVQGQKVNILMAEPYASEHYGYIARYEQSAEPRAIGRIRTVAAKRKNGEVFPIEISIAEVATAESKEIHYTAFIRDISDKVRLQNQLIENERLVAIGTTMSVFAHEIGNPINAMYVTVQLLERYISKERDKMDGAVISAVEGLKKELARLSHLLHDFRSLSRREKYNFRPISLPTLVGEIYAMEADALRAQGIRVQQNFPAELLLVRADHDKLEQALLNLCKNASEAMPQGGTLSCTAYRSGDQVVLEIRDTGIGIPDDIDIFEPFMTTKSTGTGLGLMIVRQIIAAHGGTVGYSSKRGEGTVFRVSLPVYQPPAGSD